jgi:hypothetical protein
MVGFGTISGSRLQITSVNAAFHADGGHEAPQGACGSALPDTATTWIQHPSDPDPNSYPGVPLAFLNDNKPWSGDCFHPNNEDAQAYANAVIEDLRRMGR